MLSSLHPLRLASEIAEQTAAAWRTAHIDGRIGIPLSAVAVLAMNDGDVAERRQMRKGVLAWDDEEFAAYARAQWAVLATVRPDLFVPASPLVHVWAGEKDLTPRQRQAAKRTADAAVRAGLIELTGTERRLDADVFGLLLTKLRSRADHQARGQYYTPPEVCDVLARLLTPQSARMIAAEGWHDFAAGSGGMLRAVANQLRWSGVDPARVEWAASDPDEMAIACLAVNVVLWGLGGNVVLAVTDALASPSLEPARQQSLELRELMRRLQTVREEMERLKRSERFLRRKGTTEK